MRMNRQPPKHHQQKGVAILTALIITGIAVSLAATLAYRQHVSIRLSSNLSELEQAYQYVHSMEDFARAILELDHKETTIDSLDELWVKNSVAQPIPGGSLSGKLYDLNARINLNDMVYTVKEDGQFLDKVSEPHYERVKRLLQKLNLPEDLADAVIDWIDRDSLARSLGAESDYYLSLEKPYITSNSDLANPSELRLIKGFEQKTINDDGTEGDPAYKVLAPYISTLPRIRVPININTASAEVLASLGDMNESIVQNIIADRETTPYEDIKDFLNSTGLTLNNGSSTGGGDTSAGGSTNGANNTNQENTENNTEENTENQNQDNTGQNGTETQPENPANTIKTTDKELDVVSTHFVLQGKITLGRARLFINTVMQRDDKGKVSIIQREFIKDFL